MILELIGALIRYIWITFINIIKGKKLNSFSKFIDDKKFKVDEKLDKSAADTIVGGLFLIFVFILIYHFT